MELPKTIFKYEDTSNYALTNLKRNALYMASPTQFNDPYDCALSYQINEMNEESIQLIKNKYLASEIAEEFRKEIRKQDNEAFKIALLNVALNAIDSFKSNFLQYKGTCCFSERNNELLMWAHYSDSYKGFCLEFKTEYEPFVKLREVNYVKNIPKIDICDRIISDDYDILTELYCTKSDNWAYEKEWRLLHDKAGTLYHYRNECLKAIYFGPRMDGAYKEILCLILQGQNPEVEFWEGKLSTGSFNINFNRINYIPYVAAKAMGLKE